MTEISYKEACAYIEKIPRFAKKNRPENTQELLGRLGHPEDCFRTIHVAGTNGKGSVCSCLESILREEGFRTGIFISPHLVSVRERFQIDRRMVPEETFVRAFLKVYEAVKGMEEDGFPHPAYFEFLFAMGMLIFQQARIDVCVMETGLGGRLDATNCVRHPSLTVVTSISFDHMEYLGDTIGKIAFEKAGIIKKGVPVVADGFPRDEFDVGEALSVIRRRAEEERAPLTVVTKETSGEKEQRLRYLDDGIEFTVNNHYYRNAVVHVPFFADYQAENCLVAMTAAAIFGEAVHKHSQEHVLSGIRKTRWPGRMEYVLPGVVVDGAHNDDGIVQFMKTVRRVAEEKHVSLLFSAVSDKDYDGMARELCKGRLFDFIVTTKVGGTRAVSADTLAAVFRKYTDVPVCAFGDARAAFRTALERRGGSILFCAGSLYLAGEIEAEISGGIVQAH